MTKPMFVLASTGFLCLAGVLIAAAEDRASPVLSVSNGVLLKAGKPYAGIGLNYFGIFKHMIKRIAAANEILAKRIGAQSIPSKDATAILSAAPLSTFEAK